MAKSPRAKSKPTKEVPTLWNFPEDIRSGFATNILVQVGEDEVYVSFFELRQPVLLGPGDVEKLESVTANCIARVVVTPDRLEVFIDVLQKQLTAYRAKKAKLQKSNGTK